MPALEVIGSEAAISQLLSQAISIIQTIQEAREHVEAAFDSHHRYKDQLDNLLRTLRLVRDQLELQTPAVVEQIQLIISAGRRLQGQLDVITTRLTKNKATQYRHATLESEKEENDLEDTMKQLDRARSDLMERMIIVNVGVNGTISTGFTAVLPILQRVDQNMQDVLGMGLAIATQLRNRNIDTRDNTTIPLPNEDIRAPNLVDKVAWKSNQGFDDANVVNTDLVQKQDNTPMERLYENNSGHGRSMVINGRPDAAGLAELIRAKRGG